jgi:hypothetical protein
MFALNAQILLLVIWKAIRKLININSIPLAHIFNIYKIMVITAVNIKT